MILYPNAKINLGLRVEGKRDDGYHDLQTVFYPVRLCDELEIKKNDSETDINFCVTAGLQLDCKAEDNLIVRTCRMFQQEKTVGGVDIRFAKHIPFGAGLGGGSSDAAHTALALNEIFNLGLSKDELKAMVSRLGADCAFFIENTPCIARGIGDRLTPIDLDLSAYYILLVKPDIHVSTKGAYAGIDKNNCRKSDCSDISEIINMPVCCWKDNLINDFEQSVFILHPEIGTIKQKLYELGAVYASMSGSGSTMFGLFEKHNEQIHPDFGPTCKIFKV